MLLRRRLIAVVLAGISPFFVTLALAMPELSATPTPQSSLSPPRSFIWLDDVTRSNSRWYQLSVGGSIYDIRRETIVARWSPGFQVGRRFENAGYFLTLEFDQSFDFTQEVKRLDVFHLGLGVELLFFLGHVRSSLAAGASFLRSDTDIDEKGKTGWFLDLRPTSLRWAWGKKAAIEFTPLSVDATVPVTKGIPLVLVSYFTLLTVEYAEEVPTGAH